MNLFKKPIFIAVVVILVIIISSFFIFSGDEENEPEFFIVKKGAILQEVSVVGNVKPVKNVNLAFGNRC